jgi:hypothetical protein
MFDFYRRKSGKIPPPFYFFGDSKEQPLSGSDCDGCSGCDDGFGDFDEIDGPDVY